MFEDNWGVHKNEYAVNLFRENRIERDFIPTYSPDISWQEKAWANLASRVYAGGRKFTDKAELTTVLKRERETLATNADYRRRLVVQGEAACRKIIDNQGYRVHWD